MEFFDRKEEVIEIKLTQFGKRKLADGFFKPKFYAFYDDDFSFGSLVKRGEHLRASLTDCLIGNVDDQDFRELFDAMSDLADLPEPVEHGLARVSK